MWERYLRRVCAGEGFVRVNGFWGNTHRHRKKAPPIVAWPAMTMLGIVLRSESADYQRDLDKRSKGSLKPNQILPNLQSGALQSL